MSGKSYLVGIAGPSGAGKSYLAHHLAEHLQAQVLPLDHYYRDLSYLPLEDRARSNFDEPAALEHELLIAQISDLHLGKAIEIPTYNFTVHTRTGETRLFQPAQIVIVEGLFTFHWPELRALLGTRVYVEMTDGVCLQRRRDRDVRERGRTPESVVEQFRSTVAPMAERYVRPTRTHAHLVVSGAAPISGEVARVLEHVRHGLRLTGSDAVTDAPLQPISSSLPIR